MRPAARPAFATLVVGAVLIGTSPRSAAAQSPCDDLHEVLDPVPHVSLLRSDGRFDSLWDGSTKVGCQLRLETSDSILAGDSVPNLTAEPGTTLYLTGWRPEAGILADGPGSGIYGIRKGSTVCVIRWEQPTYVDDAGNIIQSNVLTVEAQCSAGASAAASTPQHEVHHDGLVVRSG